MERECPVLVFALMGSKGQTLVRYLKKNRQREIELLVSYLSAWVSN